MRSMPRAYGPAE